jgi:hypothetical protein
MAVLATIAGVRGGLGGALWSGRGRVLQLCTEEGNAWVPLEVCESAARCDPEQGCRPLACAEGETRCFGYQFQSCAADRSNWEPVAACVNAAACDAELGCQ